MILEFWTALTGGAATYKVKGNATTGAIYVEQLSSSGTTGGAATLTNVSTTAYASNLVLSATPKKLFGLSGYNSKATAQFIQLHDAATLPADTAVPVVVFNAPPLSNFSLDFGANGRSFATGIVACNSSTGPTKTIGSADCWFEGQVL